MHESVPCPITSFPSFVANTHTSGLRDVGSNALCVRAGATGGAAATGAGATGTGGGVGTGTGGGVVGGIGA